MALVADTTRFWISKVRKTTAWLAIFALASLFVAEQVLISKYLLPWPAGMPRPKDLELLLLWRNLSFLLTVFFSLLSLPRWQSIVGIVGISMFLYFFGAV